MRLYVLLAFLSFFSISGFSQGNGFSFSYTGPSQVIVGPDCIAELDWGHPNTPTASSNIPGGMIVSFDIYSISGGYQIGDDVGGGTTVTVFYQAIDNFGNSALFGFTISFIDVLPPYFDPLSLPDDLTVNCTGNFPIADVEVHDNCEDQDIVLTVTFTETNNAMPCTGGLITRTWVADDDLGNQATFIQTITVLPDNTPPVIANNLVNGSAPCATAMAQYSAWLTAQRAAFSATDSGCGVMTLSDNAPSPSQITSFCGVITVTFTAKDNCNNTSTVQKTFTVTNNVPPVINNPASGASGDCSQANIQQVFNTWINTHGGATATDDCSGIIWTTFPSSPSLGDTCNATINVMFIAGDGCNNFDTTSAGFILTDTTPPVITVDPTSMILSCSSATVDSLLMDWLVMYGHSEANDLCTDESDLIPRYRIAGHELTLEEVLAAWEDSLAAGCTDNVIINGVGINNILGYIAVEFTYEDRCENEAGETGYFGVTDNGRPQFVTQPSDTVFACSQNENWEDVFNAWYNSAGNAEFMDACSDVTVTGSITADSAIQYLTAALDTACQQGVSVTINFSLTDACGNSSLTSPPGKFSLGDTIPPVLTSPAVDFNASCSLDIQLQLNIWLDTIGGASASDGCGNLTWLFTWTDTSGQANNGVPGQGPYPELSGLDCAGGIEVIFTATDICQNSVSDTAIFSILDSIPPVIDISEDSIHLTCQDALPLDTPQVTDGCNGEILLEFLDIAGPDSCLGQPEIVTRIWTATDVCGNTSTAQQVYFRIDSLPPTFDLPSDTVEFCSVDTLVLLNLTDNCDPSPVSSFSDVITGMVCQQLLVRTWTVSDVCGNSSTAVQNFDLSDSTPPVIEHSPGNFIYNCNEGNVQDSYEAWLDSVSVSDGCSESGYFIAVPGSYMLEDTSTWPGTPLADSVFLFCGEDLLINADLVAFDVCGNAVAEQISFAVNDTVAPVINCPALIQVEPDTNTCTGLVQLTTPAIEEICYPDEIKVTFLINNGDTLSFDSTGVLDTIMDVGIHSVLWVASDCKGNTSTCLTVVEIIAESAVSLTCPPDTILFTSDSTCVDSLWIYPPTTTSGACAKGVVKLRFEIIGDALPDSVVFESPADSVQVKFLNGIHQVLLIARDSTGDIDTCKYFIELRDTIDPVIVCQSDTILLHPSGLENIDVSTASLVMSAEDNCGVQNILYDPATVNCDSAGQTIDVVVIAFDEGGNSDTCISSLYVATQELMPQWQRGLCDDTLRLFANIPAGPLTTYTYNWSGPNSFISNEENPVIPGADSSYSGIYILTVISESGCVSTGSVELNIQTLVAPTIVIPDDTICTGESIELTTQSYTGVVTYQWHQITPAGDTLVTVTDTPSLTFVGFVEGDYRFYAVVTQDTCVTAPGPEVSLTVVAVPESAIAGISMPLCEYDTLFLSPESVIDSLSYLWTGPGGFISNEPIPAGIPVTEIDSSAVYFLAVSNAYCTSSPDSIEVIVQPSPAVPQITGDTLACEGGAFTLIATADADQFLWIDPVLDTYITTDSALTIVDADTTHTGGWRVIASVNGCVSDTSEAFVVQVDEGIDVEIVAPETLCEGDSISLAVLPVLNGLYSWGGPGGFASDESNPTTLAEQGIYTVFVQTTTGCEAQDSLTVNIDVLPSILSLATDADTCVDGTDDVSLWAITDPPSTGAFVFQWNGPAGFASQDSSPVIPNFDASLNGVYTLFIINGSCITDTASLLIDVKNSPAAPVVTGQNVYCFGDTIILNIESPIAGGIYTWMSSDTTVVIPSPGTLIFPDATHNMTGIYNVHVEVDGCESANGFIAVQVRPALSPPVITSSSLVCEGDSLVLSSNSPSGSIVQWLGPNGFTSNEFEPVIFPATAANAGEYFLYFILNGCPSDTSAAKVIEVQSTISSPVILTDIGSVCIDDPAPLTLCFAEGSLTDGALYTWILNGSVIIEGPLSDSCIVIEGAPLLGGANVITAIATLQGCLSDTSDAIIITGDEFPTPTADAGIDMQYCPDEEILLDANDPSPAVGVWSSSSGDVVFANINDPNTSIGTLPPGEYNLSWVLSFESCINYTGDSVLISVLPSPETFPDTVNVPFGQTVEFISTANDSLHGDPFTIEIISQPVKGNALHAGNGVFRYTPNIGFVGTDMMTYKICSTDCPEECSEAVVILFVGNEDDCFTPTLFTPNNDGVNDRLIVPCLETERYPDNKIIVFNEWGDAVFEASPYENDWDGTFSGDDLPVGTYFYIMDFGDGSEVKKSFLVIER